MLGAFFLEAILELLQSASSNKKIIDVSNGKDFIKFYFIVKLNF